MGDEGRFRPRYMKTWAARTRRHDRFAFWRGDRGVFEAAVDHVATGADLNAAAQRYLDPIIGAPGSRRRRDACPTVLDIAEVHARQVNAIELRAKLARLPRRHIEPELLAFE